jgi:hypothetical protein
MEKVKKKKKSMKNVEMNFSRGDRIMGHLCMYVYIYLCVCLYISYDLNLSFNFTKYGNLAT